MAQDMGCCIGGSNLSWLNASFKNFIISLFMMDKLLRFLSGKKTIIASVLGLTSTYLASKGYI